MSLSKQEMVELSQMISTAVVTALKDNGLVNATLPEPKKKEKTAYAKTEQLLYNYNNFHKIVEERYTEIEEIKIPTPSVGLLLYHFTVLKFCYPFPTKK